MGWKQEPHTGVGFGPIWPRVGAAPKPHPHSECSGYQRARGDPLPSWGAWGVSSPLRSPPPFSRLEVREGPAPWTVASTEYSEACNMLSAATPGAARDQGC